MRIIFVNRFFAPDESATSQLLTDLATLLVADGHEVTVIASRRIHNCGGAQLCEREIIGGVEVRRVAGSMLGAGIWARLIDYATFTASASIALWRLAGPNKIVVAMTDPPMLSAPAALMARLRGATLVNWLQDIFPEVAMEVSGSRLVAIGLSPLCALRNLALRSAAMNLVLGERMAARLHAQGIAPERVEIIHNWAPFGNIAPVLHEANALRAAWGLQDEFVVGYSGNMGRAHEFKTLVDAAERLKDHAGIRFLLIGGGRQHGSLRNEIARRKLANVQFRPYQPNALLAYSLGAADVHLVSLAPRLEGLIVPSKFYGIAAAGRPTIFIGSPEGEIARLIEAGDCGRTVRPGDSQALAESILGLSRSPELCTAWGARAHAMARDRFDRGSVLAAWRKILHRATQTRDGEGTHRRTGERGTINVPAFKRPRIAVLFQRLGPYHHARLRAVAEVADVIAVEMSDVDHVYDWDQVSPSSAFQQITAFPGRDADSHTMLTIGLRLDRIFRELRPDVVAVPGWSSKAALAALAICKARGTPVITMSASTAQDFDRRKTKEFVKRQLLKLSSAALAGGKAQANYLGQLGVSDEKIFLGYDVVDNAHFERGAKAARNNAASLRAERGLPEKYFLTVSRFIAKKNLPRLLDAFAQYRAMSGAKAWGLVLLGDGPGRPALEQHAAQLGLGEAVLLAGFKQYHDLPTYYGLASAFVLASLSEQWGLVVNEAMAAGLPVLVSRRCGCAPDLVEENVNGFCFEPEDTQMLAALMLRISLADTAIMGAASRRIVDLWSPKTFGTGLLRAAERASGGLARHQPRERIS